MKQKIITLLLCTMCIISSHAQGSNERGIFAEINAGYGTVKYHRNTEGFFAITPSLGYRFNKHWTIGGKVSIETAAEKNVAVGVYGQYYFNTTKRLIFFTEAQLTEFLQDVEGGDSTFTEAGLSFGASYAIHSNLNLIFRYGYIGFSGNHHRDEGFAFVKKNFLIDGNLRRLHVGLRYCF